MQHPRESLFIDSDVRKPLGFEGISIVGGGTIKKGSGKLLQQCLRSPCAHRIGSSGISNLQGNLLKGKITGHLTVHSLSLQNCLLTGRFRQCRPPFSSRHGSGHLLSGNLQWSLSKHLHLRAIESHKQYIRQCPK